MEDKTIHLGLYGRRILDLNDFENRDSYQPFLHFCQIILPKQSKSSPGETNYLLQTKSVD